MKTPKSFLIFLLFVVFFLFFVTIPVPIRLGTVNVPIIDKELNLNFDSSKLNLDLGPIKIQKDLSYRLGLDLQGGTSLVYQVDMKNVPKDQEEDAFAGARNVIERRINFFGVTEPSIQSLKVGTERRIVIDLPGATKIDQALELIGKTAELSFWEDGKEKMATAEAYLLPLGLANIYQNKPLSTKLTGKDLESAKVVYGSQDGTPQVQLNFSSQGTKYFADITKRNVGKPVSIVLDNVVISAPVVQQEI